MVYNVYTMRDIKTGFMTPTVDVNDDAASRAFAHAVANSEGILYTFAKDFSLYRIGSFNSDTGCISPDPLPTLVLDGIDALNMISKGGDS